MVVEISPLKRVDLYYEFGSYQLHLPERVLLRAGEMVALTPKALETLRVLVERSPHVVEKDELLRTVWTDSIVEEATLAQNIFTLRKALAGDEAGEHYIVTVPKRGYRFIVPVRIFEDDQNILERDEATHQTHRLEAAEHSFQQQPSDTARIEAAANEHTSAMPVASPAIARFVVDIAPRPARDEQALAHGAAAHRRAARRKQIVWMLLTLALVVCIGSLIWFTKFANQNLKFASAIPFQQIKISSLMNTRNTTAAIISPDGRYVVYASEDAGEESLWLRQVVSSRTIQIVAPATQHFLGLTFSRDGNYINYTVSEGESATGTLYQTPLLGGTPRKILEDVRGPVSFSPDGARLTFFRVVERGARQLIIANADGSDERILAQRELPNLFVVNQFAGPSWSPDGKVIACPAASFADDYYANVVAVRVADGVETPLSPRRWYIVGHLEWLADASGLILLAADQETGLSVQVWHLSYPRGELRQITNDLNDYSSVSVTSDAKTMLAVQNTELSQIWLTSIDKNGGAEQRATQITNGLYDGSAGVAWTPDRKIAYTTMASNTPDVWMMNADGTKQHQLTSAAGVNLWPVTAPDGRTIVVSSNRTGNFHLWRINLENNAAQQVTTGAGELNSTISPDGRWLVYTTFSSGTSPLWKAPLGENGAPPVQLNDDLSMSPAISSDGKTIACFYKDKTSSVIKVALIPFAGGQPTKLLDLPPTTATPAGLKWSLNGQALLFVNTLRGVSNLWKAPLDGSPPVRLTSFNSDLIFSFDVSPDEKQIVCARGKATNDAVLIREM